MASNFKPVPGTWNILETNSYRQYPVPIAQREIKSGDACWLNTVTGNSPLSFIEPALSNVSKYSTNLVTSSSSTTTYASSSATAQAAQESFAAKFIGICLAHRTPRSYAPWYANWATPSGTSGYYDTSAPYVTVVTSGIADVPWLDASGNTTVQTAYAIGQGITVSAFKNNSSGFTDAAGLFQTVQGATGPDYGYFTYCNSVTVAPSNASIVARLVKNAKVGDGVVRVEFSSYLSVIASGQVAGVMIV